MATIKFSGIGITEMRGKLGGTVLTRNASGAIARNWVNPVYPGTAPQLSSNNRFALVVGEWQALSESEREAWVAAAELPQWAYTNKVGEVVQPTGQQLFVELNLSAFEESFPITSPPVKPGLPDIQLVGALLDVTAPDTADFGAIFDDGDIPADTTMILQATGCLGTGIMRPKQNQFRQLLRIARADFNTTVPCGAEWEAVFGSPLVGKKVFFRAFLLDNASGVRVTSGQSWGITVVA